MRPDLNIAFIALVVWCAMTTLAVMAASYLTKLARWRNRRDEARK